MTLSGDLAGGLACVLMVDAGAGDASRGGGGEFSGDGGGASGRGGESASGPTTLRSSISSNPLGRQSFVFKLGSA